MKRRFMDFFHKYKVDVSFFGVLIIVFLICIMVSIKYNAFCSYVQIVANVSICVGILVAVRQYLKLTSLEIQKIESDKVRTAVELAGYYKNNIIKSIMFIDAFLDVIKIKEVLMSIDIDKIVVFDKYELEKNFDKNKLNKIDDAFCSNDFEKSLIKCFVLLEISDDIENILVKNKTESESVSKIRNFILRRRYAEIVTKLLNDLEYFAMQFTHGTADESVVFQSLNQTYIQIVRLLYYEISKLNNNDFNSSKYYTNLIKLFGVWKEKSLKNQEGKIQTSRSCVSEGTVVSLGQGGR